MMEAFTAYIKTIAAFTLFAAFAEMIMPEGSFKKYIHLVMGILLLTASLSPILSLFHIDAWDMEVLMNKRVYGSESKNGLRESDYYSQQEQQRLMEIYGKELNSRIKSDLEKKFGGPFDVDATFEQNMEDENFGAILAVTVNGQCDKGEELKRYMERNYSIAADSITINIAP